MTAKLAEVEADAPEAVKAAKAKEPPKGPAMARLCLVAVAYTEALNALNGCQVGINDDAYGLLVENWKRQVRSLDSAGCARGTEKALQKRATTTEGQGQ